MESCSSAIPCWVGGSQAQSASAELSESDLAWCHLLSQLAVIEVRLSASASCQCCSWTKHYLCWVRRPNRLNEKPSSSLNRAKLHQEIHIIFCTVFYCKAAWDTASLGRCCLRSLYNVHSIVQPIELSIHLAPQAGLSIRSFQKNAMFSRSFAFFSKEQNVLHSFAFFIKRKLHSLRSFMFFTKERCVLCILLRSL